MKKDKNKNTGTAYSTFSAIFYINRNKIKKNGLCPLMGRISINTEVAQFSAKMDVDPSLWDAKAYRMKGKSRHAVEVNRHIEKMTADINRHYKDILDTQGYITAELVKNAVNGIGQKKETLMTLFEEHNEEYARQIGITRKKGSFKIYEAAFIQLRKYIQLYYGTEDIPLRKLEYSFIEKFDTYLRIERKYSAYTVSGYTIILRKIIRRAIGQGSLRCNPFAAYIPEQPPRKRRHMTQEELELFINTPVVSRPLCHTKDMFIFCCYTGLSYADLRNLSKEHIYREKDGSRWIKISRQKTGSECMIRLLDIPLQIMEKYAGERKTDKIFNVVGLSSTIVNLNKIARLCGIEKHITFHMARHNFATLITLSQGVPLETVSRMMGHKCMRTTQIYAKMTHQKINEDIKKLTERIGKKFGNSGYGSK